jgi:tetratricopeptide (TPR) repeat protein
LHSQPLIFCVLLVAVCYANSLPNQFIQDDLLIVANNETIRTISPLRFLGEPYWPKTMTGGTYRPLTIFAFSIEYSLWGTWAPGYRITNLLLHAVNGWLVFLLAGALLGSASTGWTAWVAAAVYLVHPVHTESVVGIVGRNELLAGGLMFAAWLMFRAGRTGWASVFFFLSLLGKENSIIFPAVVALDVLLLAGGATKLIEGWKRFAVLGGVAVAYLALRFSVLGGLGVPAANQYMSGTPMLERWITSGRVFLNYFRLIVAPVDVAGSYEFNSIPMAGVQSWDAWVGLALVAALITLALLLAKKLPAVSFAILFFFVALLPVSNWIMPLSILMAERLLYTPLFGVALLAAIGWSAIPSLRARRLVAAGGLATAVLLCISHNLVWADEFSYYRNMVRVVPDNVSGRVGYGFELQRRGRVAEAKEQFEAGLRVDSRNPTILAHLAQLIVQTNPKACDEARPLLERALQNRPNHWQSNWTLANCATLEGQREKADEFYRRAVEHAPVPDSSLLFTWGLTLEALNKKDAAIEVYRRAADVSPWDVEIKRRLDALQK